MTMRGWTELLLAGLLGLAGCDGGCPDESGVACVFAGTGELGLGDDGLPARQTDLYWAMDMEFAPDGRPYLLDWNNHLVRRVNADGTVETIIGDFVGDGPGDGSDLTLPGAPGNTVRLNHPTDIQFDGEGNLILAAWHNHKLRVWDPSTGLVHVMCGRGGGYAGDGGPAESAIFNQPKDIVLRDDGSIYILDQRNHRIRLIAPDGTIDTVVGAGTAGFSGDGGDPLLAELRFEAGGNPEPSGGITMDDEGILYIADGLNHRIRRVDFVANTIETVVGTGEAGFSGDGGPGTSAQVSHVRDVEIGPDGRLYFADTENDRIRAWDPSTGVVETVAGSGERAMGAEGVEARAIALDRPFGLAFGPGGALYVADTFNSRFLRIPR
jgi:sugar lactone lactonase YvrE